MTKPVRFLFFVDGMIPTAEEEAAFTALRADVKTGVRNASKFDGTVEDTHSKVFTDNSKVAAAYEAHGIEVVSRGLGNTTKAAKAADEAPVEPVVVEEVAAEPVEEAVEATPAEEPTKPKTKVKAKKRSA